MRLGVGIASVLFAICVLLVCCGCFLTATENLKNGSTMLRSSYKSLTVDYDRLIKSFETAVAEATEENLSKYKGTEVEFKKGLTAVGIAIDAMDEAIQAFGTKEKDREDQ